MSSLSLKLHSQQRFLAIQVMSSLVTCNKVLCNTPSFSTTCYLFHLFPSSYMKAFQPFRVFLYTASSDNKASI